MNQTTVSPAGRSLTPGYGFIHAFFWMAYAASTSYTSIYLLDAGFSNTQIGILIATVSLLSAFLQPATAAYADATSSLVSIGANACKNCTSLKRIALFLHVVIKFLQSAIINRFIRILSIVCIQSQKALSPLL